MLIIFDEYKTVKINKFVVRKYIKNSWEFQCLTRIYDESTIFDFEITSERDLIHNVIGILNYSNDVG